jgi:hypothetical protein
VSASAGPPAPDDNDLLIEEVAGAWRPRSREELRYHPAWHDLSVADRDRAFDRARALRKVEAALDANGLSTTAQVVLARIRIG